MSLGFLQNYIMKSLIYFDKMNVLLDFVIRSVSLAKVDVCYSLILRGYVLRDHTKLYTPRGTNQRLRTMLL